MRLFQESFLGILLIIIGSLYLLRYYLHWNISVIRVTVGVMLILAGLSAIFGSFGSEKDIIFDNKIIKPEQPQGEYNIIFSSGIIDLSNLSLEQVPRQVEINTIFGRGELLLSADLPVLIKASSAFGSVQLPNATGVVFGESSFFTPAYQADHPYLLIKVNVVFGNLVVKVQPLP